MKKIKTIIILSIATIVIYCFLINCANKTEKFNKGLIGIYFSEANLTSVKSISIINQLELLWSEELGYAADCSGKWEGFILAPTTGEITFYLETNKHLIFEINHSNKIEVKNSKTFKIQIQKGERYPVEVTFLLAGGGEGFFKIKWDWEGSDKSSIDEQYLVHSKKQLRQYDYILEPDPQTVDRSKFLKTNGKHVTVFYEPGRFGGWPANNGIWQWGDEILVAFLNGAYKEKKYHHSLDNSKPSKFVQARSRDGGETWILEEPANFEQNSKILKTINFAHPDFALRLKKDKFLISYDKGKSWDGTFTFPNVLNSKLTSRTDYLITDKKECLIFLSAKISTVKAILQDRAFCANWKDGGETLKFVSWIAETDTIRSVMPSTVRVTENHLVSALRRRYDADYTDKPALAKNWIDVYQSFDNGQSWQFLNKIANTDRGKRNGNPPSLVRRQDGLLCVTYGYRNIPFSIRARVSRDNGKTWGNEILVRDDAWNWDIGYTRSVVRSDGKIVTIYYYTTEKQKENHIAATIWDPDEVR